MTTIAEIALDVFSICTYVEPSDLQFRQFLILDEEPLLYHTGPRRMFEHVRDAVSEVIDPASLRWVAFSPFEADECGALNLWLQEAPAQAVCSANGALVSVDDFAFGKVRPLGDGELDNRLLPAAFPSHPAPAARMGRWPPLRRDGQRPLLLRPPAPRRRRGRDHHGEPGRGHAGDARELPRRPYGLVHPVDAADADTPWRLDDLHPRVCATMHGSAYVGDGAAELRALADMLDEVYGAATPGS